MTYRELHDDDGRLWEVWEVRPAAIERRQVEERRRMPREFADRRNSALSLRLLGGMRDGWLTFQCGSERRRLAPIPEGWAALTDETLLALAAKAAQVGRAGLSSRITGFGDTPAEPPPIVPEDETDLFK
jgi:hypothetical protein